MAWVSSYFLGCIERGYIPSRMASYCHNLRECVRFTLARFASLTMLEIIIILSTRTIYGLNHTPLMSLYRYDIPLHLILFRTLGVPVAYVPHPRRDTLLFHIVSYSQLGRGVQSFHQIRRVQRARTGEAEGKSRGNW